MPPTTSIVIAGAPDDATVLLESVLKKTGSDVLVKPSGSAALHVVAETHPQLVILYYNLEDMTAPEFCRRIRENRTTRSISLLFVPDHESEEQVDLCMAAGCNDIILQPVDLNEFRSKVELLTQIPTRKELRTLTKVQVDGPAGSFFVLGQSVNISSNGMLLEVDRLLSPETVIRASFYLPDDAEILNLQAQVFRAEFDGNKPRYGLHFVDISAADKERIDRYVQALQKAEASGT